MRKTLTTAFLFLTVFAAYSTNDLGTFAKSDTITLTATKLGPQKNERRRELEDTILHLMYRIHHGLLSADKLQCLSDQLFDSLHYLQKQYQLCTVITEKLAESEIKKEYILFAIEQNDRRCDTLEQLQQKQRSLAHASLAPVKDMYQPIWSDSKKLAQAKWELFELIMPVDKKLLTMFSPETIIVVTVNKGRNKKEYIFKIE